MSQHSEERLPTPFEQRARSAQILPFERPQSDLQKAVQLRAQEEIELKRRREETHKAPVARWIIGLAVALLPVLALIVGLDGFLRVFHQINAMYESMPSPEPVPAVEEPLPNEPGVVMLRPMDDISKGVKAAPAPVQPEPKK